MTLALDLYWSFRSPYCYLALDRILGLTRAYELEVDGLDLDGPRAGGR